MTRRWSVGQKGDGDDTGQKMEVEEGWGHTYCVTEGGIQKNCLEEALVGDKADGRVPRVISYRLAVSLAAPYQVTGHTLDHEAGKLPTQYHPLRALRNVDCDF
jgi:hypothetical protein